MNKLPSVKEALEEVTFTFILSPFPKDYANVSVPVTSESNPCSIYSFIKSNILNISATKTNRRLLCMITFFCDFKQSLVFHLSYDHHWSNSPLLCGTVLSTQCSSNSRGKTRASKKDSNRQQL